ncbi:XRE family transcriptional regulator [Thermus amyloliquefaciens]|uniref:XRE family transcriptional regulator n=1 Tax=Thermus amyloliquefaciens TaxID=1449080 RepID=UPI0005710F2D|nr:XRE family transcriptional regulator [Thermus amyloliquefaciens]
MLSIAPKDLAAKLRQARDRLGLSQDEVAQALGVSRESLAQWERGDRLPPALHLQRLAWLYGLKEESLFEGGEAEYRDGLSVLLPEGVNLSAKARFEIQRWLEFLDAYAEFLEEEGEVLSPVPQGPLKELHGGWLTDVRRASSEARKVRERLALGQDVIPDLRVLLDELGILVYHASLGEGGAWGRDQVPEGEGSPVPIWGAFYRHPQLGFSVLVNVDSTPGRQIFTLAHELSHALYHFRLPGILCRREPLPEEKEVETFANAWAAHFLVPGKALREQVRERVRDPRKLSPEDALLLAHHFGVSYTFILYRLLNERLISKDTLKAWSLVSPRVLAEALGLSPEPYRLPAPSSLGDLGRFPPSVLRRVRRAVYQGRLSVSEAAGLLDVDSTTLQRKLLASAKEEAEPREALELSEELDFLTPGRRPKALEA